MKRWQNQYIDKVREIPEYIFELQSDRVHLGDLRRFLEHLTRFDDCVVEIGSGSGMHLLNKAAHSPRTLHIGIELRYKRAFRTIEKGLELGNSNVFILRGDARQAFDFIPHETLSGVFMHFPDPWIKRRVTKHRLLTDNFFQKISATIKPDGFFSFRSDNQPYFQYAHDVILKDQQWNLTWSSDDYRKSSYGSLRPESEFESLFVSQGLTIGALLAKKSLSASPDLLL